MNIGVSVIRRVSGRICAALVVAALVAALSSSGCARSEEPPARSSATGHATSRAEFAVIGDFGTGDANESAVASLVASWDPQFVISVGDQYYKEAGGSGTSTFDRSVGAFYCRWLKGVTTTGTACSTGEAADRNAFFPAVGNHEYLDAGIENYLEYFDLPGSGFTSSSGNERYYDFVDGPVHFFAINGEPAEPDGIDKDSKQAAWLKKQLTASTSPWNIVYMHRPPYTSDKVHGSEDVLRWPYAEWGADAVISGHAHDYERVMADGIVYFVNGAGGDDLYDFRAPIDGSEVRFNETWGAQRVTATPTWMEFVFETIDGRVIDRHRISK